MKFSNFNTARGHNCRHHLYDRSISETREVVPIQMRKVLVASAISEVSGSGLQQVVGCGLTFTAREQYLVRGLCQVMKSSFPSYPTIIFSLEILLYILKGIVDPKIRSHCIEKDRYGGKERTFWRK